MDHPVETSVVIVLTSGKTSTPCTQDGVDRCWSYTRLRVSDVVYAFHYTRYGPNGLPYKSEQQALALHRIWRCGTGTCYRKFRWNLIDGSYNASHCKTSCNKCTTRITAHAANSKQVPSFDLLLVHSPRRWPSIKSTLVQCRPKLVVCMKWSVNMIHWGDVGPTF